MIAEESDRLSEIVNDLLLASQLDTGKLQANVEPCDPREIAQLELDAARTHLPENVALALDAPEELPAVAADPGQLRQVLSNLIDNAIKYSPDGGTVTRRARAARTLPCASRSATTGSASRATEQRRIFEKFYRLDPDMTQRDRRHRPRPLHLPRARAARRRPDLGRVGRPLRLDVRRRDPAARRRGRGTGRGGGPAAPVLRTRSRSVRAPRPRSSSSAARPGADSPR